MPEDNNERLYQKEIAQEGIAPISLEDHVKGAVDAVVEARDLGGTTAMARELGRIAAHHFFEETDANKIIAVRDALKPYLEQSSRSLDGTTAFGEGYLEIVRGHVLD